MISKNMITQNSYFITFLPHLHLYSTAIQIAIKMNVYLLEIEKGYQIASAVLDSFACIILHNN